MFEILEPETPEFKFPVARKSKNSGDVVLFWQPDQGVVVSVGEDSEDEVGDVSTDWAFFDNTTVWIPVDLKITG